MAGTGPDDTVVRVAVAADKSLVGHAVRTALVGREVEAATIWWHPARDDEPPAHQLATLRADVGLLLCALDPLAEVADALWLVAQSPMPWLVLSEDHARPGAGAMLEAGCVDVWPADSRLDDVAALLRRAPRHPVQARQSVAQLRRWHGLPRPTRSAVARLASLSARERSVVMGLVAGRRAETIAGQDEVAVATVRTQVRAALRKLEVNSQLEAVALVRSLGGTPTGVVTPSAAPAPGSPAPPPPPGS